MGGLLHLVQRGGNWAGPQPAQGPLRCTKCNSPPINGQCTNYRIAVWIVGLQLKCPHKALRRFRTIPACDRQTDGQNERPDGRINIAVTRCVSRVMLSATVAIEFAMWQHPAIM